MSTNAIIPSLGERLNHRVPYRDPQEVAMESDIPSIYIWSLYRKPFIDHRGTLGRFVIPAREEGADISAPLVIKGVYPETGVDSMDGRDITHKWLKTYGRSLALDIMGQGPDKGPSQNLAKYGVFISAGPEPTMEEIDAAQAKLDAYYGDIVRDADQKYQVNGGMEVGEDGKPHSAITVDHVEAAKALGLDRPWARKPSRMMNCEECGEANMPAAARCKNPDCRMIFDEAKCRQRFPEMFAYETEKRGPGRPPKEQVV